MKIEFFTIDELNYLKEHCDFTEEELYLLDEKSKGKTLEETGFDIDTLKSVKRKIRKALEDRETKTMTVSEIQQYIDKVLDPPLRTPEQRIKMLEFGLREVKRWIGELETKSKWKIDGHHRRCEKCGEYFCIDDKEGDEIPHNFCGNCGAKMEVEDNG